MSESNKAGGTIYAIGAVGTSLVKIGSTRSSVTRRLRALQTGQPFPLQLLATVPVGSDVQRIEKQVHAFLEAARRRGEWFDFPMNSTMLEKLIVRAVKALGAQEALPLTESARVARWRQRMRAEGKVPLTIWLPTAENDRLLALAREHHCSPSEIVRRALAAVYPRSMSAD